MPEKKPRARTPGPLVVSKTNPRYFAVAATGEIVYLTGSHINNNFHDGMGFGAECSATPEEFDYPTYLAFLKDHGHNFIRLWRWEQFKGYLSMANVHFCMTPQPWPRTGPGIAKDGKPRFDLSRFDDAYFERIRNRVVAAGKQGIYVSVMFFEGFSLHLTALPDNVEGHPFHAANNINGIGITSIVDYQVLPLDPPIQRLQEAYIRRFVDTVHDLPNVLYEVANESSGVAADGVYMPDGSSIPTAVGDSTRWQYWVIDFVKQYERERGHASHPIGMTFLYPVADQAKANDPLWASAADWISPGFDDGPTPGQGRWLTNPPPNDGSKVVLSDTDHYSPFQADALWAWKSMLRGHNPLLYDLGILDMAHPPDPSLGVPAYESYEPARHAMGDTRRFAERIDLARMEPRGDLSSTGYALVNPGHEYLVLQVQESESFTVTVDVGTYAVEWYSVKGREQVSAAELEVESSGTKTSVCAPPGVEGSAVLYLKRLHD
jgi:hypothetical protein